jgi:hypothetical protein
MVDPVSIQVDTSVCARSGRYRAALYEEMLDWCEEPAQPGLYMATAHRSDLVSFRFSDAHVAFEFKMRFG